MSLSALSWALAQRDCTLEERALLVLISECHSPHPEACAEVVAGRRRPRVIDMVARQEARLGLDPRSVTLGDMARADEARSASAGLRDTGPARWPGRSATAVDRVTVVPAGVVHPGTVGRPVAESRSVSGLRFDGSRR